jgi:hypothetical protein
MKKSLGLIFFAVILTAFVSTSANAQILINYKYSGGTLVKSDEGVPFKVYWTVTYEASWKLFFNDEQKIAIQKRIKTSCNNKLTILFGQYTSGILVVSGKSAIQEAVDNPNFVDALAETFLSAFAELFSGNVEEVPEFNVLKLKLDKITYYTPNGYIELE